MEEADQLSDRIGIIDQAKSRAWNACRIERRISQQDAIRWEVGVARRDGQSLRQLPTVENVTPRYTAPTPVEVDLLAANSRAIRRASSIGSITTVRASQPERGCSDAGRRVHTSHGKALRD